MSSNLKRKQPEDPNSQIHPSTKQYSQKCHCSCSKKTHLPSLSDTCQNFINSKTPSKIMIYKYNQWVSFPETALKVLINGFKSDKSNIVVFTEGQTLMVDFLTMTAVSLKTGKQNSISWIDESGKCFFPPLFIDQDSESDTEKLKQSKKIKRTNDDDDDDNNNNNNNNNNNRGISAEILRKKIKLVEEGSEVFKSVEETFRYGLGPFRETGTVVHVHRYEPDDELAKLRLEKFEQNCESGTMRYGWYGGGKREIARVLIHGFEDSHGGMKMQLFMPADRAFSGVNQCDVDEKGVQYMLLCRVTPNIPSQAGIIINPKYYSISSHSSDKYFHPEYLVSFRLSPVIRDYLMGLKGIWLLDTHVSMPYHKVRDEKNKETGPTSPWLSLANLYGAIMSSVSPIAKELLLHHYDELKKKKITREELVKIIRIIVGDKILRETITKLQRSPSSWLEAPVALNAKLPDASIKSGETLPSVALTAVPGGVLRAVPGGANNNNNNNNKALPVPPISYALPTTKHVIASDSISVTSRSESAKKCIIDQKIVAQSPSESAPSTSRGELSKNLIGGKMPYYSLEQGMQLNNAAIDSILRAAKLDPGP